jgi:hypothetical protein
LVSLFSEAVPPHPVLRLSFSVRPRYFSLTSQSRQGWVYDKL